MPALWKTLVLALVVYAIYLHRKLLYLTDAAYQLAHEARYSSIETSGTSLHDTVWGGEVITMMSVLMGMVIVLAVAAVGRDAIGFLREQRVQAAADAAAFKAAISEKEKPAPPSEPPGPPSA